MSYPKPTFALYPSAARIATPTAHTAPQVSGHRGLIVVIDVTAKTSSPSVVFTVEGQDTVSGKWYTLLTSAAITNTGTTVLRVFPGATPAANLAANDLLPANWRVTPTHANGNSITYSVSGQTFE